MARRVKKEFPLLQQVAFTGIAAEGKAIARVDDKVLFVPFGAPGDTADIKVTRSKKTYMEGRIVTLHTGSPQRINPFCEHFTVCGGCKWQHLPYSAQLQFKRQQVIDAFERIGGFLGIEVNEVLASPDEKYYRNKLEFTFTNRRWLTTEELGSGDDRPEVNFNGLGFHLPGQYDRVLHINQCYLQPEPSNNIRSAVFLLSLKYQIPLYNVRTQEGVMRNIIIRNNSRGEFMVVLVVKKTHPLLNDVINAMQQQFPQIVSLNLAINPKPNDDISNIDVVTVHGEPYLKDNIGDLQFKIGPKSFYQTNTKQVIHLYQKALEFASLAGHETVYDLYTGTGTIALFAARCAGKVIGIEYIESAVEDARHNAISNNIDNSLFFSGDIAKVMNDQFIETHGSPHVIITDPPRGGMHPAVIKKIMEMCPNRIIYVSCNPATQARDIAMLSSKYGIEKLQPVDMFPHTHHIENIALLKLL